jgi:hypothetical protein
MKRLRFLVFPMDATALRVVAFAGAGGVGYHFSVFTTHVILQSKHHLMTPVRVRST